MAELKGQWVFVDFTASWCLTCKVNKRLVLDTDDFKSLAATSGLKLLRADWTKRDDIIAKFLDGQNVVGIPAYFIQKPDCSLVKLGETISISKVKETLNQ
jgi:thiol:disulfide interchange protein DsbD